MTPRHLSWIAKAVNGRLVGEDALVDGVCTDSRAVPAGRPLFIALKGEHFDGHAHVASAVQKGCVAALVAQPVEGPMPSIIVDDTQLALAHLAAAMQHERQHTVLAVTGSNGKTTVKALLLGILRQMESVYANPGNRNNEIGLPLAVLEAPEDAQFAIYEMGAGKPGDIAYLTNIVRPNVALVNNVAPAHLERMGNVLGVAQTKGAIYAALPDDGVAVINADDAFALHYMEQVQPRRIIRFALEAAADVWARDVQVTAEDATFMLETPKGAIAIRLPLLGRHNILNALAASAMALAVGASLQQIQDGLATVEGVPGRLQRYRLSTGAVVLDDSYNANPGSLRAAIDALMLSADEAWLVLGNMGELGANEVALHAEVGTWARQAGVHRLYTLGELSAHTAMTFGEGAVQAESHQALADLLNAELHAGVTVLLKGSRSSAMENVVQTLLQYDAKRMEETHHVA